MLRLTQNAGKQPGKRHLAHLILKSAYLVLQDTRATVALIPGQPKVCKAQRSATRLTNEFPAKQCYHCQGLGHVQADCPTLRISGAASRCYSCGQAGHIAVSKRQFLYTLLYTLTLLAQLSQSNSKRRPTWWWWSR